MTPTHINTQQDDNYYSLLDEAQVENDDATVRISNRSDKAHCRDTPPPSGLPTTVPGMVPLPTIGTDATFVSGLLTNNNESKINPTSTSMATRSTAWTTIVQANNLAQSPHSEMMFDTAQVT